MWKRVAVIAVGVVLAGSVLKATRGAEGEGEQQSYALEEKEAIRRIKPPFSAERMSLYRSMEGWRGDVELETPSAMQLYCDDKGKLTVGGTFTGSASYDVSRLIEIALNEHDEELEGDFMLIYRDLPGDFILREKASAEEMRKGLEKIIGDEIDGKVTLTYRTVVRRVIVLKGDWTGVVPRSPQDPVEVYGQDLNKDPRRGEHGSGDLVEFGHAVGYWIRKSVIVEATGGPTQLEWHFNDGTEVGKDSWSHAHDEKLVLGRIQEQTGLAWREETREVRRLFIEPMK